ncbi:MAG: hypothetical protein P8X83_08980 [Nitrosopumilaceae archaeon]
MTRNKITMFAIPVLAAILVGGSFAPASAGFACDGKVIHYISDGRGANANYVDGSFVHFFYGQENCPSEGQNPVPFGHANVGIDGCSDFVEIDKSNFMWGFGHTVLSVDTICGEVLAYWQGNSPMMDESQRQGDGNCHDGRQSETENIKYKYADSVLYLDGEMVDETDDPDDAIIFRGNEVETECETNDD